MTSPSGGLPGQQYLPGYGWVVPIKDRRGNVLYYADPVTGARVPRKITGPATGPGSGNTTTTAQAQAVTTNRTTRPQAANPAPATSSPVQRVWLDGQYVTVTVGPDGTWTTAQVTDPSKPGAPAQSPSAFDALDGNQLETSAPFLMGYKFGDPTKPTDIANPFAQLTNVSRSVMTVGGGVAWFAELATKDPEAYQAMLDKLHNAGYLTDADYASAAGHWSSSAGTAFATAARDVAVVNTTTAGQNTTLNNFLDSKQGALEAKKAASSAAAYKPVDRQFTDPEDIKATAKTEAQQVLGRELTPGEESQLVGHFRGLETAMYDTIDAAGKAGGPATFTKPGSGQIDHFVDDGAREQEAANFHAATLGQALKNLLSGGS